MKKGSSMELKEKIIDAVIEEFNEKGLKFTMDDIAKHMGISKRTLYTVVQDKEALFLEAVDTVFTAIKQSEKEIVEDTSLELLEKLKRILIVMPERYRTIDFRQLYGLKSKFPRIYAKIETRLETDWEATFLIMEQAMEAGKIRKISLPVFQAMFTGTIEYYLSRSVLLDSEITYVDAVNEMLDILIHGVINTKS
jgi:AcrR family transcriptional regulator